MTHLSDEELKSWYELGKAEDRSRVIGHLAECETCRRALSTHAAAAEPETSSTLVSISEAVPRGYAARRKAALGRWSWLESPLVRLAGAVAVVFVVIWATTPTVNQTRRAPAMMTAEGPGRAEEFTWDTPFKAARYRISVRDATGALVFTGETNAPPFRPDPALRAKLVAGESYTWRVESLDLNGAVIGASLPATFTYQP